jgi:hypothetical protein
MKANFRFKIGNRGLLQQEVGLVARVNEQLAESARKHGYELKPEAVVTVKRVRTGNGKVVLRVSAANKEPVEVPLAAA